MEASFSNITEGELLFGFCLTFLLQFFFETTCLTLSLFELFSLWFVYLYFVPCMGHTH